MTRAIALACASAILSCKAGKEGGASSSASAADVAPIAPPASLFADATLRDPDAFWNRVRSGGGGSLMSLPDTAAGVLFARAHLDPRLAHLVAGGLPFQIALGEASGGGLAFAIAMKVRDLGATRAALGSWDAGGRRAAGGMEILTPASGASAPAAVTALSPAGYLVLASNESELGTLGAYAAQTLPTKPPSTSSLTLRASPAALAQAGVKAVNLGALATSSLLGVLRHAAPPAFDPSVFVACVNPIFVARAAMLGGLAAATIDVDTGDGELHAVATLEPKPGDSRARRVIEAARPADPSPLLEAPGAATYAIFASDTAGERASDASVLAPCFERAFGGLLGREGTLAEILAAWAKGRGDWDTASVVTTPASNGFVFRAPLANRDAASQSLHDLTDLVGRPPVADAVVETFGVLPGAVTRVDLPTGGQRTALTFGRPQPAALASAKSGSRRPPPLAPPPLGIAWSVGEREIELGVGEGPTALVSSLEEGPKLGADLATAQAIRAMGSDSSFVAVLKPFGCCVTGGPTSTPLTIGWGRRSENGWARVELGYGLVVRLAGN